MKASFKRRKGGNLEREFAKLIRRYKLDSDAQRRPMSGALKMVSGYGDIYTKLPFAFECKWQERMDFWGWWEQAESQQTMQKPAVLVHKANDRPIMVSMKAETFLNLLKELKDYVRT